MTSERPLVIDEALLCCPLCMRSYREPRILPCLHTFCRVCLEAHLTDIQPSSTERLADMETLNVPEPTRTLPDLIEQLIPLAQHGADSISALNTDNEVKNSLDDGSKRHHVPNANVVEGHSDQPKRTPRSRVRPPIPHKPAGLVVPPHPGRAQITPAVHIIQQNSTTDKVVPQSTIQTCTPALPPQATANKPPPPEQHSSNAPPTLPTQASLSPHVQDVLRMAAIETLQMPQLPKGAEEMDCHYEQCEQIYEEVKQGLGEVIIKINNGDEEYYCIPESDSRVDFAFDPNVDYIEPIRTITKVESMKINKNEESIRIKNNKEPATVTCAEGKAGMSPQFMPKEQKGNFLSNLFRRKTTEKGKPQNSDLNDLCAIRELPSPPSSVQSPYSPSPSLIIKSLPRAPIPTPDASPVRHTPPSDGTGMSTPININAGRSTPVSLLPPSPNMSHSSVVTPETTPTLTPRANLQPPPQLPKRIASQSAGPVSAVKRRSPKPQIPSLTENHNTAQPLMPSMPISVASPAAPSPLPPIPQSPLRIPFTRNSLLPFSGNPTIVNHPDTQPNHKNHHSQSHSALIMNCPTCSTEFAIPATGVKGLKMNSFVTSLQEVVLSQSDSQKQCNNCETSAASFWCLDCWHYLCGGCRNAHNWLKITQTHRVMTLEELHSGRYQKLLTEKQEMKCDTHAQNKVELMCLYCDKSICSECKINEHSDHRVGHLGEAADRDRDLLRSLIDSVQTQRMLFEGTRQDLLQYKSQCVNENQELIAGLEHQRDRIIEAVNKAFLDLVEEIDGAYVQELNNAVRVQSEMESTMAHMNHNCEFAEQLLIHGKTEDVLVMSRMIKPNLNEFSFAAPFELDTRAFVQFSPADLHKPMFLPLFGHVAKRRSDIIRPKHVVQQKYSEKRPGAETTSLLHSIRAKTPSDTLGCKPSGLTLSMNDDIVIVDDTNKKIKVFGPLGVVKMELRPAGEYAFIDPWDVTITYQGHLAVTDKGARCVKVFDSHGQIVHKFGPHLKSPWGIAANSRGHLIVTDILVKTVFVHDEEGNLLHPIECKGHANLFMCPEYVKINHNDDIIVSDFVKHCITVFDSQGRFLFRYGSQGSQVHQFTTPCGIGVDKAGHILVADYTNSRVHKLTRDGQFMEFVLSTKQGIVNPQTLLVNSRGHLVVLDGPNIKTFSLPCTSRTKSDHDSDTDSMIYEPLQFSNKLYGGTDIRFSRTISESDA